MKRRSFIRLSSAACIGSLSIPFVQCGASGEKKEKELPKPFALAEMSVATLQSKMKSGELTSASITASYLQQIALVDSKGPALKSVIEINPDAEAIAKTLDDERKAGKVRGPMHGIPVLIKDNIDTKDKMQTTAGSLALEGNIASADAFLVQKLREAGAVILGKTNLSEWANFRSSRSVSGWSSRGGQTHNPYVLDRSPCGSSSGSGVAVAANLCAVSVGTETNGSIACPASMNNVVGIKPTVGLVSRSGIIPISKTQDTAGPFGRTVADAAALLGAIRGFDKNDAENGATQSEAPADYAEFLKADGLKGKRIGIDKKFLKQHEAMDALLDKALSQMKSLGATIVEIDYMQTTDLEGAESTLLQYEFKDGVNAYLAKSNAKVKSLAELIAYNNANQAKVMPDFRQELFEISQKHGDLNAKEYLDARKKILNVRMELNKIFEKQKLDALCGPATGPSWCIDPVNGDFWTGYGSYGPAAVSGFPSITVPMGFVNEIPVGISFLGKAFQEPLLITIAYSYEQISKNRRPPKFLKTI